MIGSGSGARVEYTPAAYDMLAASLGCAQKVSQGARDDGAFYMTEYLPRDQSRREFNRRFRVALYALPMNGVEAGRHFEEILHHAAAAAHQPEASVRERIAVPMQVGGVVFLDYSAWGGHFLVVVMSTGEHQVAVLELATHHGAIPSLSDVNALRSIAFPR
jgi:hypothetical protein